MKVKNVKTEDEQNLLARDVYFSDPEGSMQRIINALPASAKIARVRCFTVIETEHQELPAVVHVPSGFWSNMNLSFEQLVQAIESNPDRDDDLIHYLFS